MDPLKSPPVADETWVGVSDHRSTYGFKFLNNYEFVIADHQNAAETIRPTLFRYIGGAIEANNKYDSMPTHHYEGAGGRVGDRYVVLGGEIFGDDLSPGNLNESLHKSKISPFFTRTVLKY